MSVISIGDKNHCTANTSVRGMGGIPTFIVEGDANFFFKVIAFFILFIYLWLRWVFIAARGLSLVVERRDYSSLRCMGFSLWWLLLLWSTGSRHMGFSSCGTRAQ